MIKNHAKILWKHGDTFTGYNSWYGKVLSILCICFKLLQLYRSLRFFRGQITNRQPQWDMFHLVRPRNPKSIQSNLKCWILVNQLLNYAMKFPLWSFDTDVFRGSSASKFNRNQNIVEIRNFRCWGFNFKIEIKEELWIPYKRVKSSEARMKVLKNHGRKSYSCSEVQTLEEAQLVCKIWKKEQTSNSAMTNKVKFVKGSKLRYLLLAQNLVRKLHIRFHFDILKR